MSELKSVEHSVLEYILTNNVDYEKICKKLALEYPAIFMMIVNNNDEIISLLRSGKRVQAIKERRIQTGCGLKEAKDYVDKIRDSL